ncbi:hypothetical protein YSA_11038 [Pseudomonas putida ND6]|uniref:Uncharacterized protein n=1 Tax=Pseudomonas putida ND6 TaxID=231023 RepID=I3V4T3_PSEPU|nr:hypothetical protein YSA_11038 [Pseudomonas putida ND6]
MPFWIVHPMFGTGVRSGCPLSDGRRCIGLTVKWRLIASKCRFAPMKR